MQVNTSRFGQITVADDRVITFPKGLLGFARYTQFVLIEPGQETYFWWLQSTQTPDLAFIVTDPSYFVPTYRVPLKVEQMQEMSIGSLNEAQVLVIVNKRGSLLTGNLQGPLVINVTTRTGEQLVLSDRRFTTRVPLIELGSPVAAMSA